jgi:hypothetical protein
MTTTHLVNKKLKAFVDSHEDLSFTATGKVHCSVTDHDIVSELSRVKLHLSKTKYKCLKGYGADYSQYLPYIVPHNKVCLRVISLID